MRRPPIAALLVLLGLLWERALAGGRSETRHHLLVLVDSKGAAADDLALTAYRAAHDRRSRVRFQWIRIGSELGPGPSAPWAAASGAGRPQVPGTGETRETMPKGLAPIWDPEGASTKGYGLDGVPRLLLVDEAGTVLRREAFLPPLALRYLCRHPDRSSTPDPRGK